MKSNRASKVLALHDDKCLVSKQTEADYLNFFTTEEGADMLPYAYLESSEYYDDLVKNNHDYYLFSDEVMTITANKHLLTKYLDKVSDIVEIGPGSDHTMQHKTLPIISYAKSLKRYHAIDISKNYLKNACDFIGKHAPNLEIFYTEADLMQQEKLKIKNTSLKNKCVLFLGSTLGNFTHTQQNHVVKQISQIINKDDLLILTVDTNQDEKSLLNAYVNFNTNVFIHGIIQYYSKYNPKFAKYIDSFEIKYDLDKLANSINIYFVTKEKIEFDFNSHRKIKLFKGQELRGVKSRKHNKAQVSDLLNRNNFSILDVLSYSNKMQLFICKKN